MCYKRIFFQVKACCSLGMSHNCLMVLAGARARSQTAVTSVIVWSLLLCDAKDGGFVLDSSIFKGSLSRGWEGYCACLRGFSLTSTHGIELILCYCFSPLFSFELHHQRHRGSQQPPRLPWRWRRLFVLLLRMSRLKRCGGDGLTVCSSVWDSPPISGCLSPSLFSHPILLGPSVTHCFSQLTIHTCPRPPHPSLCLTCQSALSLFSLSFCLPLSFLIIFIFYFQLSLLSQHWTLTHPLSFPSSWKFHDCVEWYMSFLW